MLTAICIRAYVLVLLVALVLLIARVLFGGPFFSIFDFGATVRFSFRRGRFGLSSFVRRP